MVGGPDWSVASVNDDDDDEDKDDVDDDAGDKDASVEDEEGSATPAPACKEEGTLEHLSPAQGVPARNEETLRGLRDSEKSLKELARNAE